MPPKTAIRSSSGIAASARSVGTKAAVLITRVASMMPQGIRHQGLFQSPSQASVRGLDQDRADKDAAIRNGAAVLANEPRRVETGHHLGRDAFFLPVAAATLRLSAKTQGWKDL